MRFLIPIILAALLMATALPAQALDVEFSASVTGFVLDLEDPLSLPDIGTIKFDPEKSLDESVGLLPHTSIRYKPTFSYDVRTTGTRLIQVKIEDLMTGQTYASKEYVATGSAGTDRIHGEFKLNGTPFRDYLWSFLISCELRSGEVVSKIFHVYLIHSDFEPDITEQNKYISYDDPQPQTIYEGDVPGGTHVPSETTGFIVMEQNEADLKDMLINPILYELIKARPFQPTGSNVPPGSRYTYSVKIHWTPVVGTVKYSSGFLGSGNNAFQKVLREKKVCLYVADPDKSVPELRIESMDGEN